MKKLALSTAIIGSTLLMTQPASANSFLDDVTWVPQIGMQYKQLKFEQELKADGEKFDDGDLKADLPSLVASFTAIYQKAYISLQYADSNLFDNVTTDSDVPFTQAQTQVERSDFSVTAGYNVWDNLNLFVGYLEGKTKLTPEPLCTFDTEGVVNFCNAAGVMFDFGRKYEQTYKEDGIFVGGSYGWKLMDTGTLSFSMAYADLDSTYEDNYFPEDGDDFKYTGDADGFSFGLNWSQPLTEHVGYYLDARTQKYEANTDDDNGNFPGTKSDVKETITTFTAGVQWYL